MKLIIKNKLMSIGGASTVKDENENDLFIVKGKVFTITKKKIIYDMDGNKLFTVRNKFWRVFTNSAYIYDASGKKIARLKDRFSRKATYLSEGFEETFRIGKNPNGRGKCIYKNEEEIGVWCNMKLHLVDTYEIEYKRNEDASIIVALVIAIDNIQDKNLEDVM